MATSIKPRPNRSISPVITDITAPVIISHPTGTKAEAPCSFVVARIDAPEPDGACFAYHPAQ